MTISSALSPNYLFEPHYLEVPGAKIHSIAEGIRRVAGDARPQPL